MNITRIRNRLVVTNTDINGYLDLENIFDEYVSKHPSIKRWNDEVQNSYHWLLVYHLTGWTEGFLSKLENIETNDLSDLINNMFDRDGRYYKEFFLSWIDSWMDYWDDFCDEYIPRREVIQIKDIVLVS